MPPPSLPLSPPQLPATRPPPPPQQVCLSAPSIPPPPPPHTPQPESEFAKAYEAGLPKAKYWEPVLEDSLNLIAKLPALAAAIYRRTFCGGRYIAPDPELDWAANLAHMMGARPGRRTGRGRVPDRSTCSVSAPPPLAPTPDPPNPPPNPTP
jgi:hypothetical protein